MSRISSIEENQNIDFHKVQASFNWSFSEDWKLTSTLSVENGFNELYPGDGVHQRTNKVILEEGSLTWRYAQHHEVTFGRFYLPIGTLNGKHNTVDNYGALRNPVEIHVIPTNWVETGVLFKGQIIDGLQYDVAAHSALIMPDGGLVRDGRNPDSFSISKAHAFTLRMQYIQVPGLTLSTSVHFEVDTTGWVGWGNNSAILSESHALYRVGRFGFKAFFAYWDIDGVRFERTGREKQNGWYAQADYQLSETIGFFSRLNEWDNEQDDQIESRTLQWDLGLNWWFSKGIVFKADFSKLNKAQDSEQLNLGVAWRW